MAVTKRPPLAVSTQRTDAPRSRSRRISSSDLKAAMPPATINRMRLPFSMAGRLSQQPAGESVGHGWGRATPVARLYWYKKDRATGVARPQHSMPPRNDGGDQREHGDHLGEADARPGADRRGRWVVGLAFSLASFLLGHDLQAVDQARQPAQALRQVLDGAA